MYPGIEINENKNLEGLKEQLETDLGQNPSSERLTDSFHKYVENGDYEIEGVLYSLVSSNQIFPEVDESSPLRIEKSHDYPDEDAIISTFKHDEIPFAELREQYQNSDRHRHRIVKYEENSYGGGSGRALPEHRIEVPDNVRELRERVSDSLIDFVKDVSERTSTTIGHSSSLYGDEEFAETAWKIFQDRNSLKRQDIAYIEDTIDSCSHDPNEVREEFVQNQLLQELSQFNREILREMYGDNTQIPLRRAKTLNPETENEIRENSTFHQERPLPDSWGFKDLTFYRRAENYGLGIDTRNSVQIDDVTLSPHLLNGIMEFERGEWIVNYNKEEFSEEDYRLIQEPEAEFIEPEMIWTYEELKDGDIV